MSGDAAAATSRYTDGDYLAANPGWHEEDAEWKVGQVRRLLARNRITVDRFCDVGCGTGLCTKLLLDMFPNAQADGYEFSPQAFARAQRRTEPRLRFHNRSPFDDPARFDLAVSFDVMEHVENAFEFVRGLGKIASHVLLHIPLDMNALAVAREWPILAARRDIGHLHYFSRGSAIAMLRECGLEIVDEVYTPWAIDQSYKTFKKRLAALPRRAAFAVAPHAVVRAVGGWSLLVLARSPGAPGA